MSNLTALSLSLLLLVAACGSSPSFQPAPPPPPLRPPLGPPPCARPVAGGYMDNRLGTRCTFRASRGARVCVPDNMGIPIFGVCDPKGGPDRIWVNREPNCLGDGSSKYILHTDDDAPNCGALTGTIGLVDPTPVADQVLYDVLPPMVAEQLKRDGHVPAVKYGNLGVLFADIAGFTRYASRLPPDALVMMLNQVFSRFDELAERLAARIADRFSEAKMIGRYVDLLRQLCPGQPTRPT